MKELRIAMYYTSANATKRRKKNGEYWQLRVKYKDTDGKWKDKTKSVHDCTGKREAKKRAKEWMDELNEAYELSPTIKKDLTVAEAVKEYIDYQLKCGELEESTHHNRTYTLKSLVNPYIGDISFISLDRIDIMSWLTKLNALGLSQGSIGTAFYTVRKTYRYYYEMGELAKNPFMGVKPPKKGNIRVSHLTDEQMAYFIECLKDEPPKFKMACYLAFYAGLRRGEICGLRWRDIDFEKGTISIVTAIGIGNKKYTKQPKNNSSTREFPLVPQVLELLREYVEEPNYFVIGNKTEFIYPSTLNRHFKRFIEKNKIVDAYDNPVTLHALRHNIGTVGINSGMDIASLSKMMGHNSKAMTLDTYGDSAKNAMDLAAIQLGEKFKEIGKVGK